MPAAAALAVAGQQEVLGPRWVDQTAEPALEQLRRLLELMLAAAVAVEHAVGVGAAAAAGRQR